jgi:dolichyl-diphosphooligosaccharide--protein glycosyltransferase
MARCASSKDAQGALHASAHHGAMRSPQVRVFKVKKVSKKSKDWVADPANRVCDAPGSWFCSGQYPPALQEFISKRRDFKQLEDFNVKKDAHSQKYHEEYMRKMGGG